MSPKKNQKSKSKKAAPKKSKVAKLYKFIENRQTNQTAIGLTEEAGIYQGVIYNYNEVQMPKEDDVKGNLNLTFGFDVIEANGLPKTKFVKNEAFDNLIGNILVDILADINLREE